MKYQIITFFCFLILAVSSCDSKRENQPKDISLPQEEIEILEEPVSVNKYSTVKKDAWQDYYQTKIEGFNINDFKKEEAFKIIRTQGTVTPIWDKNFNPIYKQFFAFNADSTQYVDIDSYKWTINEDKKLEVTPDQEIVLVNIPNKKVERLLFYGPSFWVEEAYFKNDSVVILLENSTEKIPAYQEINLNQNTSQYYLYKKSLDVDSEYYKNRISDVYQLQN